MGKEPQRRGDSRKEKNRARDGDQCGASFFRAREGRCDEEPELGQPPRSRQDEARPERESDVGRKGADDRAEVDSRGPG